MKYLKLSFCSLLSFIVFSGTALAQLDTDTRAIYDRMDRLERDITLLQRRIYKSDTDAEKKSVANNVSDAQKGSVEHLYSKITELENVVSQMTAQFEELNYQTVQMQEELKKLSMDINVRFEKFQTATVVKIQEEQKQDEKVDVVVTEPVLDAKSAYNAAYDLLKDLKYEQAQIALSEFLEKYPEHELAGNAQYWLGETFYVRRMYEDAAIAFATGFKKYKNSTKSADNLLKLGLSMQQLDKKKEACTAFKSLKKEFSTASSLILTRADNEAKKLGCYK
ncbi:MAG: tol-pal system protein YbgF [Alphaproteobacteria bacterium]|nr:tol-pal system protein YbgF [Alphaproteobacteria bacterium]